MSINSVLLSFLVEQKDVQKITVPKGVTVCQSGDTCENLVIVLEGQVKVFRPAINGRSLTLYYVNSYESCTLTASCILNDIPFPAFAVTTTDVIALSIPPEKVIAWLEHEPMWQKYMFSLLSQRMINLIELVDTIAFESLDTRLAQWLLSHLTDSLIQTTHQQIAEDLASSREVISRLLKKFERDNLIALSRGAILVKDKMGLTNVMDSM
jgi:CRP/FNR family transcriptional regulator